VIDVQVRINAILERMNNINKKFYSYINRKNNTSYISFGKQLAEVQEKIYQEKYHNKYTKYDDIIKEKAHKYSIPVKLIKSIIKQESNFNPKAVSPKGAQGLMQLIPETAKMLGVKNVFNPEENIEGGVKYLRLLLNRYNGDILKSLAAYNAGPEIVDKYNGIPNFNETKTYIKNILKNLEMF